MTVDDDFSNRLERARLLLERLLGEPLELQRLKHEPGRQVLRGLEVLMRGRTTVIITHFRTLASTADRVLALEADRVIADGPPRDLLPSLGRTAQAVLRT
jgi:ABC-type bacteriocin/lantibiotic exporter with double-glycine peptidase domain